MSRTWKRVLLGLLALSVYLTAESALPPSAQPTAQLSLALIHGYQATGSKMMASGGVHCRYQPTCSHYAADAIAHYGGVSGLVRAAGRLWRCSPWGGSGYDPAVEEHPAAYVAPQQETPDERKVREEANKKAAEDFRKAAEELNKLGKDFNKEMPHAAGKAAAGCLGGCAVTIIMIAVHFGVMVVAMLFVWKDAKARGDANAPLWLILIFFLSWVGAIVYFVARPKGDLTPCPACHQKRLSTLAKCPHCGAGGDAAPAPAAEPPKPPTT
jgi:hypothetical protein